MRIPEKISVDNKVSGRDLKRTVNMIIDVIKSLRIVTDNKTISATVTGSGTLLKTKTGRKTGGNLSGGGTSTSWAKITAVTDSQNYTCEIWSSRQDVAYSETGKALYVYDIADELAVNDWIKVESSDVTGKDYQNANQLGAIG